jgi:hypothetical protein
LQAIGAGGVIIFQIGVPSELLTGGVILMAFAVELWKEGLEMKASSQDEVADVQGEYDKH